MFWGLFSPLPILLPPAPAPRPPRALAALEVELHYSYE